MRQNSLCSYYFRGAGGNTLFASSYLSYEYLSEPMKAFLEDKIGIHDVLHYGMAAGHFTTATVESLERLAAMRRKFPQVEHPLVCLHPETGRKMLYINKAWTTAIKGLHPNESRAILDVLKEHSLQDHFQCRVRWFNKSLLSGRIAACNIARTWTTRSPDTCCGWRCIAIGYPAPEFRNESAPRPH